jgi:hypothetical protein
MPENLILDQMHLASTQPPHRAIWVDPHRSMLLANQLVITILTLLFRLRLGEQEYQQAFLLQRFQICVRINPSRPRLMQVLAVMETCMIMLVFLCLPQSREAHLANVVSLICFFGSL